MNVIFIGAHPDDCETKCGGTAARMVEAGHRVKFVSVTDGSSGHQTDHGPLIAARRLAECEVSKQRLGLTDYEILTNRDGHLQPTIRARAEVIRVIREWHSDIVVTHRLCDYHPDHRYTSTLVQDSAYLVMVPGVCPNVAPLRDNPIFLYMEDDFTRPYPFQPHVVVDVASAWEKKMASLDAHVSQYYEWLPWIMGEADQVPADAAGRKQWLEGKFRRQVVSRAVGAAAEARYGVASGALEAFELSEYGRQPEPGELDRLFPR
ncbi:MAG TPA: PIG-L family deacetylase [Bryobacteraceae bacterium]|nr:PIG-L family deacetylase [Bryobacteraceae bacterium]